MPEQPPSGSPNVPPVQPNLHEVAELLRQTRHLKPEEQAALSDLIDELARVLGPGSGSSAETAHLAQTAAHLARSLHQQPGPGLLAAAKQRLEAAAARAEAKAPTATEVVRQILETLANFGI